VPGFLMVVLGLGTLAAEFEWARVLLDRVKEIGLRVRGSWAARREAPGA
jgi:hypothetical protein